MLQYKLMVAGGVGKQKEMPLSDITEYITIFNDRPCCSLFSSLRSGLCLCIAAHNWSHERWNFSYVHRPTSLSSWSSKRTVRRYLFARICEFSSKLNGIKMQVYVNANAHHIQKDADDDGNDVDGRRKKEQHLLFIQHIAIFVGHFVVPRWISW